MLLTVKLSPGNRVLQYLGEMIQTYFIFQWNILNGFLLRVWNLSKQRGKKSSKADKIINSFSIIAETLIFLLIAWVDKTNKRRNLRQRFL